MQDSPTLTDFSDFALITAARQGDLRAFGELVARYQNKVINVVYRMCGDPELAQEAAQDAFVSAWQNLHKYDPQRPLQNWLFRMATNAAIDVLRQSKPVEHIDLIPIENQGASPESSLESQQRAETIRQAVLRLPAASRSVLVLREYEGLSYQEISDTLQIPLGTVMSRLNYARNQLRQSLKALMEAG